MTEETRGLSLGSVYRSAEAWEWAHESSEPDDALPIDPGTVTAVMVVHNAEEWLQRQLLSLASLSPRPGAILVVDNGSSDGSSDLLERALEEGVITELLTGSPDQGFGAAVAQALAGRDTPEWIWLLHDDSAPKRGALAELLKCVVKQSADVLTPKLLMPKRRNYPDQLLEVGRSIAPLGRQVITVETGDIDQHQLDPEPTLGASTAGLFIRGSVWQELGGLDPDLVLFRDGVDFGWRANDAGFRVLTCPQAALYHRQAGRLGWRKSDLAPRPQALDRAAAMHLLLAREAKPARKRILLWFSCIARMVGFLLGKSLTRAKDELAALKEVGSSKDRTARMRERIQNAEKIRPKRADSLRPVRYDALRALADGVAASAVERYRELVSTESDISIDDLTGGDFDGGRHKSDRRFAPILIVSAILLLAGIVSGREWFGAGGLAGGGLLPPPETLAEAWSSFIYPTAGVAGSSPLWLGVMALGSTVAFGQPFLFVVLLLILSPLLSAWAANALLRLFVEADLPRAVLAGAWGVGLWILGLPQTGSLTGIAWAIGLPMMVRAVFRWIERGSEGAERWRGPAATAGWLILLTAAYPLAWLLAVPAGVIWAIRERERWPEVAVALGGPLVFLAGWMPALIGHPGRLLTGVDPLAGPDHKIGPELLLGMINAGSSHLIPAGILLGSVIGATVFLIVKQNTLRTGLMALIGSCCALLVAATLSRFVVAVNGGWARPEVSVWVLVAYAGLLTGLVLVGMSVETVPKWLSAALITAQALVIGWTCVIGTSEIVRPVSSALPSYVTAVEGSTRLTRTLMVSLDGRKARWSVVSSEQPQWGSAERDPVSADPAIATSLRRIAQSVSSAQLDREAVQMLADLGVGHLWVRGASAEQIAAISNTSGMARAAVDDDTQVWTVTGLISRARVQAGSQSESLPAGQLPDGPDNRRLLLAEPVDSRWRAYLNGDQLTPVEDPNGRQAFILPAGTGQVTWQMKPNTPYLIGQAIAALLLIILAAPVVGSAAQARRGKED